MSKNLVKYWTLFLIIGAFVAWAYYFAFGRNTQGTLSPCIIVTLIALDVLHPCTYLWVGQTKMTQEEAKKMTWGQALTSRGWWERRIYALILNQFLTGLLKWLGPAWFVAMPFATLFMPYIGPDLEFVFLFVAVFVCLFVVRCLLFLVLPLSLLFLHLPFLDYFIVLFGNKSTF
ncbi:unnamed protein product [Polarella glacialis]|uniref:Uncharacterized protein n=1 Tax=Polarella glacialis TaxID=89957 RepID=A0A813KKU7_POLGL|nr:unnamed protein product [Polarella glacialis]CAE8703832.1 unnamed protein product [Polarella glacialis]